MKHLPNLDVLRFFLASLVILFHVPQLCRNQELPFYDGLPIFHRGTEAVFMFFVLSGFLIIRLIYKEKKLGLFSIKAFYIRRMLRILPLYYLIVVFGFTFYNVILPFFDIPFENNYNLFDGILLTLFFLPNIFSVLYEPGGILEILWSIGVEEQFYLIIAPLFYSFNKDKIFKIIVIFTLVYFLVFHFLLFEEIGEFHFYFYFLFSGGIVAILEEKGKLNRLKSSKIVSYTLISITILYFTTNLFITSIIWLDHLFMVVLFPLFIYSLAFCNIGFKIENKILVYLGKISYGIYMFHVIALNMVVFLFIKIENLAFLSSTSIIIFIYSLTFAITIIMAHLSYKYYESYFLRLKHKYRL